MKLALVCPVLNRFELFTQMIATIDEPVRPYIIDNWNQNGGVAYGWNTGLLRAYRDGYEYALVCNDDIRFEPGVVRGLWNDIHETGAVIVTPNQNGHREMTGLTEGLADFFCFMVDIKQLFSNCGFFDSNFWPAYFEDNDMHYRIKLAGLSTYLDNDLVVHHHGSATQNHMVDFPVCSHEQFVINRTYFVNKWGGVPGEERFTVPYDDDKLTIKDFWEPVTPYAAPDVII